jgi:hypothetical protein
MAFHDHQAIRLWAKTDDKMLLESLADERHGCETIQEH